MVTLIPNDTNAYRAKNGRHRAIFGWNEEEEQVLHDETPHE